VERRLGNPAEIRKNAVTLSVHGGCLQSVGFRCD
jgi:hypothetical protein